MKFPVEKMCKVLEVSRSSYYSWLSKGPSKRWLNNHFIIYFIKHIFEYSYQSYGVERMKAELEKYGHYASKRKIARLMRELHLIVKRKHKFKITTGSNHKYPIAANLLDQD